MLRMAQRKWKDTKQQPGTARAGNMLGCSLISFNFLWAILSTSIVVVADLNENGQVWFDDSVHFTVL